MCCDEFTKRWPLIFFPLHSVTEQDSMNEVFIHWTSAWEILRFDPHHKEEVEKRGLQLEHILHQLQTCNPSAH